MIRDLRVLLLPLLLSAAAHAPATPVAPDAARAALAAIDTGAIESRSDAVLVIHGDEVLLERYSSATPKPIELMSVTKSIVALGIGALLADGKLESLDTPVHHFFPEWKQGRKQAITVRMLMDHTSGLQNIARPAEEIYPARDVIALALAAELDVDPGTKFSYNNKAVNLLAGVIARAAGEPMDAWMQRRLFVPLGIEPGPWYKDEAGNPHAMAGLPLTARDAARLGRLVMDRGVADGRALLPPDFVDTMLAAGARSRDAGLLWWRRTAWVRFHADAESFAILEAKQVDPAFIDRLRPLLGRRFASPAELQAALAERLGPDWSDQWYQTLIEPHGIGPWRPFHPEKGPVDTFEANGSLGQYLVVIPRARLVAVRQIESRDEHAPEHDYADFTARVQALADALVPHDGD
jgi:CubicO group peptidase (beta-lactamase class C family)